MAQSLRGLALPQPAPAPAWQRATGCELAFLGVYFLAILALADIFNVRLGAELLSLSVVVAAVGISRAGGQFVRDWWFFLLGLLMWRLSGSIAGQSPFPVHLDVLMQADRMLGLGHEPVVLLHKALAHPYGITPLDWITAIAYNLHLSEPYIAGYFLWRLSRAIYFQFAAAVLFLLVLGNITFILFPTVPPWMASEWYHRIPGIVNGFGRVLKAHPLPFHGEPIFMVWKLSGDSVAAIPSEHAAFPMLEFLALRCVYPRGALLLVPWVLFVLFAVVYLGMHWLVDPLVGWVYAILIFGFVRWFTGRNRKPWG